MNKSLNLKIIFFFSIYLFTGLSFASDINSRYPKLFMHRTKYENSCAPVEKRKLLRKIEKNVSQDKIGLQTVISLILCGDDTIQNMTKIAESIAPVVTTNYDGTAEEKIIGKTSDKMEVAANVMAKGRAWNTTLQFSDDEVTLQFFSSEACVESVRLRPSEDAWLVYEIGEACD